MNFFSNVSKYRAGEVAQWLAAHTVLTEGSSSILNTYVEWLTTTCNITSKRSSNGEAGSHLKGHSGMEKESNIRKMGIWAREKEKITALAFWGGRGFKAGSLQSGRWLGYFIESLGPPFSPTKSFWKLSTLPCLLDISSPDVFWKQEASLSGNPVSLSNYT